MIVVTLELSSELEAKLRQSVERRDPGSMRQLLAEAIAPTVEALLRQATDRGIENDDEFEAASSELAEELAAYLGPDAPVLSDYAVSRAGIYEGHL